LTNNTLKIVIASLVEKPLQMHRDSAKHNQYTKLSFSSSSFISKLHNTKVFGGMIIFLDNVLS